MRRRHGAACRSWDIKLTAEVYTDEDLLPLHAAMQALPSLSGMAASGESMAARQARAPAFTDASTPRAPAGTLVG